MYLQTPQLKILWPLWSLCTSLLQEQHSKIARKVHETSQAIMQRAKHGAREDSRQQVLAHTPDLCDNTPTNWWVMVKNLVNAKQVAVTKIMLPVKKATSKAATPSKGS
jgi:deoxycytidylate deaminase